MAGEFMMWRRASALATILALTSGCAYNDHFDNRVARYDVAAEQARDSMILTNIVRASHAEPMSFIQLGQLSGSNTSAATVGLPSLLLGPLSPTAATAALQKDVIFGSAAAGGNGYVGNQASTSGSTSFQATPAETKDFYRGLLSDVDPYTLEFFVNQGMSRELLFYLFTSEVIENGREVHNDPLSPDFPEFRKVVRAAVDYGLTSEPVPTRKSARPGRTARRADPAPSASVNSSDQNPDQAAQPTQLCFAKQDMAAGLSASDVSPICGTSEVSPDGRTVMYKGVRVTVIPRSVFAIFQFLGRILAAGQPARITLYSPQAIDQPPLADKYLFDVEENGPGPCFLSVDYEGVNYCIPLQGAENTKRILSILTQLLALNTSIQDIPVTPLVQSLQ
jgi:hypothetical protein